jgi:hypothetical protein
MRREGPVGKAGFESMFVDWKTCALRVGLGMFYFQGGKAAACLCAAVFASLRAVWRKKKGENPRGGHGSEKGVI